MESRITGEEFIETLTPENILYIVETSDLQTIRNLCQTSKAFLQWCRNKDFRRIIQGKVNTLREEATQILLNYMRYVSSRSIYNNNNVESVTIIMPSIYYIFQGRLDFGYKYSVHNYDEQFLSNGVMNVKDFNDFIIEIISKNYHVQVAYMFSIEDPNIPEQEWEASIPTITGHDPNLPPEFINNSGVNYIHPFQIMEGYYNYLVEIIPQEFIKDYVRKH